jgi:hypothetical protein
VAAFLRYSEAAQEVFYVGKGHQASLRPEAREAIRTLHRELCDLALGAGTAADEKRRQLDDLFDLTDEDAHAVNILAGKYMTLYP